MPNATDADARATDQQGGGKKAEIQHVSSFGPAGTVPPDTHDAILQGLNQWLPTPHAWVRGGKTYLGVRNFEGTEAAWDQVPLIYVPGRPVHPNNQALRENPDAEIARIGGRIVGGIAGSAITAAGTPHLRGSLSFDDPEVVRLHGEGNLGHSTGFDALTYPSGHMAGTVEPSHVLLFDLREGLPPNDPKAMFLNVGDPSMADDETKGLLTKILEGINGLKPAPAAHVHTAPPDDTAQKLEQANLAKAQAEKENADLKAKLLEYENTEKKRAQDAADARWLELKNTAIPKGWTHTPEKEAAERAEWEGDPVGYAMKLIHANTQQGGGKKAEGVSHVNTGGAPQKSNEEKLADLGYTSLTVTGGAEA